jgi:UDP-glucose:glycoprotein glucosyltransferase
LLLEGHCYDSVNMNPPRGLQMTLGTKSNPVVVDTIVMANLGYFQMKANPGAWMLRLRQGPSADIYDIISHEGSDRSPNSMDIKVLISSFRSHIIKVKVAKKPGKQSLNVLGDDDNENKGLWNSITR